MATTITQENYVTIDRDRLVLWRVSVDGTTLYSRPERPGRTDVLRLERLARERKSDRRRPKPAGVGSRTHEE